ncbi:MFS transporter [Flavihumibacter solisilvae]|uniref:MFS transporter n=1 Tax=Flavihumibacter solisilvae TaxID=1349421 RepID=UPI001364BAC2|nr:MFS transporter [Flavihumibacter solisilvae]
MNLITSKNLVRFFFFTSLLMGSFNFMGQSLSFGYVQGYFGVTAQDAAWLLRGFQSGTIITSIAGIVFIKWVGNRNLFLGSAFLLLIATVFSFTSDAFNLLLVSRIAAGIANGFIIAVSTQMYLSTYEGKARMFGTLNTVAANISGMCLGILSNSLFTEDYGWQFNYYLAVPVLVFIIVFSFYFVPDAQRNEEVEEDWISLIPFSILIISVFFLVMFRQQYQGISNLKILISAILAVVAVAILVIRGFTHSKPLFDTRLLQYPGFILAIIISYLSGAAFVFNISLLTKLLGGILQMPMRDVFHFINFLFLVVFLLLVITIILIAKKFNPYWLMISGLLAVAYTAFKLSRLNPQFSFDNVIAPSLIGMAGAGIIATAVIMIAVKSVPQHQVGKVANFRSVAFTMGIALTATDLGRLLDFERVRNFNLMIRYTDPGNPLIQERLNGLVAFYQANGYDANEAYDAAINGITGMVKLQSFFLGVSEILLIGCIISIVLALLLFVLWVARNFKMKLKLAKLSIWLLVCACFDTTNIKAQKTFTLAECINYAFEHNPLLNAAAKDTSVAAIGVQRVTGLYLPRVNFVSAFQYYISKRNLLVEGGSALAPSTLPEGDPLAIKTGFTNSWFPALNVNQLIFDPAYRNSYNIALQNHQLQAQYLASFKIDLITGIYKAFNTCRLLEVQAHFLEENITRIDTLIGLARTKYEKGAGVKIEVNRVEVTGNRMKSELINVRNNYSEALLALQFQMNYLERDSMILESDFTIAQVVGKTDSLMQQLLQSNPSMRIESQLLQTQIILADESVKLEQARAKPIFGADAVLGFTPAANTLGKIFQGERWKPYSYIGVNLGIPIFNGLDVKRAVEQKKIQASQSRNYLDQFTNEFENERRTTYIKIKNAYERYRYADANLKLANSNIELLHEAFINGVADNQDLILGENDLYENQARYYNDLLELMLSGIEGLRVTGSFNTQAGW